MTKFFPYVALLVIFALSISSPIDCHAKDRTFGIVSKSLDDPNFTRAWQGCDAMAQQNGDRCILIGGNGPANPREQIYAIKQAMGKYHFDALALSVTRSAYLAKELENLSVPLITYDSDFEEQDQQLRLAFVGMDNQQMGKDVALIAEQLYPDGGSVCLMTAMPDPNLEQRLMGIRRELSGNEDFPVHQILKGENGWTECTRSPWNTGDDQTRTLAQISYTLGVIKPDLLITTGHWPIVNTAEYAATVEPFADQLERGKTKVLIGGIGESNGIEQLLNRHWLHGFIKVDFYDIGVDSYLIMHDIAEKIPVAKETKVKNTIRSILDE